MARGRSANRFLGIGSFGSVSVHQPMKFQVGQRVWFRSIGHKSEKKFRGTIVATYDGKYLIDDGSGRSFRIVTEERLNLQEVPKGEVFA